MAFGALKARVLGMTVDDELQAKFCIELNRAGDVGGGYGDLIQVHGGGLTRSIMGAGRPLDGVFIHG